MEPATAWDAYNKWTRFAEVEAALAVFRMQGRGHGDYDEGQNREPNELILARAYCEDLSKAEIPKWRETMLARAFEDDDADCAAALAYAKDQIAARLLLAGIIDGSLPDEPSYWALIAYGNLGHKGALAAARAFAQRHPTGAYITVIQSIIVKLERS